jgi:DNA-binding response OmpR family regulator
MAYKLLVAHSSPSVLKAILLAFPEPEFEVYTFKSGIEVMQELNQISPDAILLSLSLHQENGFEIGRHLKGQEKFKQIPLILFYGAFETVHDENTEGFVYDELVQEPFDSGKLVRTTLELIEKRRGPQTLPEEPDFDSELLAGERIVLDEGIKEFVRKEIFEAEREIEKRIRARVLAELKDFLSKKS